MDDYLDFVAVGVSRAWQKSKTWLGVGSYILMELVGFIVYMSLNYETFELWKSAIVFIAMLFFTFAVFLVWEMQYAFTQMIDIKKRNTMHGAVIEVWNNEVLELTDLDVEILDKVWITRTGSVPSRIKAGNRSLDLGDESKIRYHGGSKIILVASGKNENATFHTKEPEVDTAHEYYDNADHSEYEIVLKLTGKLDGRHIFPKKVKGRLKYIRASQKFGMERSVLSKIEWIDPDGK